MMQNLSKRAEHRSCSWKNRSIFLRRCLLNNFLGIDREDGLRIKEGKIGANGQADAIYLLALNTSGGRSSVLAIPRETMGDVSIYHADGSFGQVKNEQICLQYAYGKNSSEGSEYMTDSVRRLLGGDIPISYYCTMSFGMIKSLVDAIGGVDITMTGNYTTFADDHISDEKHYVSGEQVHMDGEEAYHFVRYRDINEYSTNLDRVNRQKDFINAVVSAIKRKASKNPFLLAQIIQKCKGYYDTNLNYLRIVHALKCGLHGAKKLSIKELEGEERHGLQYDEFYPDEKKLKEVVLSTFFKKQK